MDPGYELRSNCRICGSRDLEPYLDLGLMPLANAIRDPGDTSEEFRAPLAVVLCRGCSLSQLTAVVPAPRLFSHYVYRSEISGTWRRHCERFVREARSEAGLDAGDLVVDIGSNDGTLLAAFRRSGFRTVGVDPASNLAPVARAKGVEAMTAFWGRAAAARLVALYGRPSLITATNVVAHVDDLDDFFGGVCDALDERGRFVIEVPYIGDFLEKSEFDTIYHEHLSYFLLRPLLELARRHGLRAVYARRIPIHGGGLRLYLAKRNGAGKDDPTEEVQSVRAILAFEQDAGVHGIRPYMVFARQVRSIQRDLRETLQRLVAGGRMVAGFGASAKGATLLNSIGATPREIAYIVDDTPDKQGKLAPGTRIPIVSADALSTRKPDDLVILAWNFVEEILERTDAYAKAGGRYIIPVPALRYIE